MQNKKIINNLLSDKIRLLDIFKCFVLLFIIVGFYIRYCGVGWVSLLQGAKSELVIKLFDLFCGTTLLILLGGTVWYIKPEDILHENSPSFICWLYALVLCAQPMLGIYFLDKKYISFDKFDRVIGTATLSDYNVAKVIRNFSLWFIYFGLLLVLFSVTVSKAKKKFQRKEHNKVWVFLDDFMVVSAVFVVLYGILYFSKSSENRLPFQFSVCFIATIIVCSIIYLIADFDMKISWKDYRQLLIMVFLLALPLFMLLKKAYKTELFLFLIQFSLTAGVLFVIFTLKKPILLSRNYQLIFDSVFLTTAILPLALSAYIELVNILAARGQVITNPYSFYPASLAATVIVGCAIYICIKKSHRNIDINKLAYPLCLFGFSALSVQIPLVQTYTPDIFESANAGILISDFLNFGKIPLVEHYGGHMMTDVWEGILYGILNGDFWGAAFSPYSVYQIPVYTVLLYFFFKMLWNDEMAFLSILLIPVIDSVSYFALGLSVVLAVVVFIKKSTYINGFIMWFVCIWSAIYRLDLGVSFIMACLAALLIYACKERKWETIKSAFLPLAVYIVLGCSLWIILCLYAGENPIYRLVEFLKISASNQNWAYTTIGNTSKNAFALCYIILPLTIMGTLCYIILFDKVKSRVGIERWTILIMLGFAYFANFSRGLVRHSYAENTTKFVVWCALLYLAAFFSCIISKKMVLPIFMTLVIINQGVMNTDVFNQSNMADNIIHKITQVNTEWQSENWNYMASLDEPVNRVQVTEGTKNMFYPIETIINTLLKENETFIDFANITFAYSYFQRECPVYVSQSPLQLSGEFTQEQFVEQISRKPEYNPIIIMPKSSNGIKSHLDGVSNVYRYYKVSEYLFSRYTPLCSVGDYAVWCIKERYKEYLELLSETDIQKLNYSYDCNYILSDNNHYLDDATSLHIYNLNHLPCIWGELDSQAAAKNKVIAQTFKENMFYKISDFENIDRSSGNYLKIDINCVALENNGRATIRIGIVKENIFIEKARYIFTLENGTHTYLIRISGDYSWYYDCTDSIIFETENETSDVKMYILSGD